MAQRDADRAAAAHQDPFQERLTAEISRAMAYADGEGRRRFAPGVESRAERSRRFWKRSTWPAVSTMVCLPVKNGWQFEQMSTCSDGCSRADLELGVA